MNWTAKPATRRIRRSCLFVLVGLLALETVGQVAYRVLRGHWFFTGSPVQMMEIHPWLAGIPKPDVSATLHGITIRHNSCGARTPEFKLKKAPGIIRVVTLGGSSTYCVRVSDADTWPSRLQEILGPSYEVINLGVPGYTTVENLIQTSLLLSDLTPDIAVYYEGWNDARNTHLSNVKPDYSEFHGRSQYLNLQVAQTGLLYSCENKSVIVRALLLVVRPWLTPFKKSVPRGTVHQLTPHPDPRALELYERNLRLICATCAELNIAPVFVPQIMNPRALTADTPYGWLPMVRDRDMPAVMAQYQAVMQRVAHEKKARCLDGILSTEFAEQDFIPGDQGHFSADGCRKFAEALAACIKAGFKKQP